MTLGLFVFATVMTLYLLAHIPAAMYVRHKNPSAKISIKWPAYAAPLILWLATAVSHYVL